MAKNTKDLQFLKEMHECSQKLLHGKYDLVTLEHLNTMIEDWIYDLKHK